MGESIQKEERRSIFQSLSRSNYSLGQNNSFNNKLEIGSPSRFNTNKLILDSINERFPSSSNNHNNNNNINLNDSQQIDKQQQQSQQQNNIFEKQFKVHYIYEKLQDRLKLRRKDGDQNFRKMMQEFKQLDTFVDTRSQIQGMNLAFQKGFKSSLEVLKIRDKIEQLNKELKDTSNKYQMQFGEYEIKENDENNNNNNNNNNSEGVLASLKGAKQAKELLRRSKKYLSINQKNIKNLESTTAITENLKGYIQKNNQTVNQIELKDDINEFYTNLESVFETQKKLISLKEQHSEFERKKQEEKERQLRELIKQAKYDMDGENEKNIPNQGYFDEYHKRTQKTISKAIQESKRIYRQKLGLINQKEKLFLDIQENIIDKALDKPINANTPAGGNTENNNNHEQQTNSHSHQYLPINHIHENKSQQSLQQINPVISQNKIKSGNNLTLISNNNNNNNNNQFMQRSLQSTPSKSKFQIPQVIGSQNSLTRLQQNDNNVHFDYSINNNNNNKISIPKLSQVDINKSNEIEEEIQSNSSLEKVKSYKDRTNVSLQQNNNNVDEQNNKEIRINNLISIPSLQNLNQYHKKNQHINSTLSTARDTQTQGGGIAQQNNNNNNVGGGTSEVDTRHQSMIDMNGIETDRNVYASSTYYTSIDSSAYPQHKSIDPIPKINLTSYDQSMHKKNNINNNNKDRYSQFQQNNINNNQHSRSVSSSIKNNKNNNNHNNKQQYNRVQKQSLPTRAQRNLQLNNNNNYNNINFSSFNNSVKSIDEQQRKKSLGSMSEEVLNIVRQMKSNSKHCDLILNNQKQLSRTPKVNELKRLGSISSPQSMQQQIERRNVFLNNIGNQQETIKQFIQTMKQTENNYKHEKQTLIEQLINVKSQFKITQEKYDDPKITSIREVEQNIEHKFKNFLRRNYKPKTMQIANY